VAKTALKYTAQQMNIDSVNNIGRFY